MRVAAVAIARLLNRDGDLGIAGRDVLGVVEVAQHWRLAPRA
ncbi:hypothetical protein [Arenibaculum pallidiluteum]|nr:hypothetical protein [Arenibaculum pallidiluteum]